MGIMTIEREDMRIAYGNFIEVLEMTTEELQQSNFKIRKPFDNLQELLNSSELSKTSLPLSQRVGFINWCNNYTENVLNEIQKVDGDTKVVESDDYWEVFIPSSIVGVKQNEIFNTIAHRCGSPMWKGVHFGDIGLPLKFDEFIANFEQDSWSALHSQLERYALRIWDDIYHKIDGLQQVCNRLDSLGKSEQTFEDCRNRVFGL
jgi:hypothetical protein